MNTYKRKIMEALAEEQRNKNNSAELLFIHSPAYTFFGWEFTYQYPVAINDELFILDFYTEVTPFKIAIEIDGTAHRDKAGAEANDRRRDKMMMENLGINTFRIPALHLYQGKVDKKYLFNLMRNLWDEKKVYGGRND